MLKNRMRGPLILWLVGFLVFNACLPRISSNCGFCGFPTSGASGVAVAGVVGGLVLMGVAVVVGCRSLPPDP